MKEDAVPTHFVGIGASAGGLEALEEFFKNMPHDTGMAFIVVQHLAPDYKSMMVELLERRTKIKVVQIEDGMIAEKNTIYLMPPKQNLTIYHSKLILTRQVRDIGIILPIDIFFRSLAIDQGKRAVGIILSGTGSDGTLGIKAIKEQGGMVMVQDIKTAKFDGMPKSAIGSGLADYILDVKDMSDALIKFVTHPNIAQIESSDVGEEENDLVKILSLIRTNENIDFSAYKAKTIIRRIERRISINQLEDTEEYLKLLIHSKKESEVLSKEFLIGVTQFFRDNEAYKEIEYKVIPNIFKDYKKNDTIRIWSVGCSTGEEAYSIAILCQEYMEQHELKADLKIFATDLDNEAIRIAGMGIYPESIIADVSKDRLDKYFNRKQESYQINEKIRQMVVFANHNTIYDPPFSNIDLLVCRNLLIYFKPEIQEKVLNLFQYSISKGGYLFLGSSESLAVSADNFEVINSKWKIFRYKESVSHPIAASEMLRSPAKIAPVISNIANVANKKNDQNPVINLYKEVVNFYAPAGVIIDSNNNIIHFFKDIKRYLNFPEGEATYNLLELASPQLTMVLSNIIHKVRKEKSEAKINKFKFKENDNIIELNITAKHIYLKKSHNDYVTIAIIEVKDAVKYNDIDLIEEFDLEKEASERIKELEKELQFRDENLQTTVEELETSNEELQATNEELVSSNEELQSTNEELQSVNEELYTVNSQYQGKISELTELNSDVNNLLKNTNIGTIFLDSKLNIRKFTKEISQTINIMEIDVGRPFSHLTLKGSYKNLYTDVLNVLNTLQAKEVKLKGENNKWFLLKIQPYRNEDNAILGIIIIQIEITQLEQNRQETHRLNEIVNKGTIGIMITDLHGNIEYVNPKMYAITGYTDVECIGKNPRMFSAGRHKKEFYIDMWKTISEGNTWVGEFRNKTKDNILYWERNTIFAIKNENEEIEKYVAFKEDITDIKEQESKLLINRVKLQNRDQSSIIGDWVLDHTTNELTWTDNVYKIFGVNPDDFEMTFEGFLELIHKDDREHVLKSFKDATKNKKHYVAEHRIIRPDGEIRIVRETSQEIYNEGVLLKSVGSVKDITDELKMAHKLDLFEGELLEIAKQMSESNESQQKHLDNIPYAFAHHKMIYDKTGKSIDYIYLDVNKAFEKMLGKSRDDIIGKGVKELIPGIEEFWIQKFGEIAMTQKTEIIEQESGVLNKRFKVSAYSSRKGFFSVLFEEMSK